MHRHPLLLRRLACLASLLVLLSAPSSTVVAVRDHLPGAANDEPGALPPDGNGPTAQQAAVALPQAPSQPDPADVSAIEALVAVYYEAYARADVPAMMALWHTSAGGLAPLRLRLVLELQQRRLSFSNLVVSVSAAGVAGGVARVSVDATATAIGRSETFSERWHRSQSFLKQDGQWRFWLDESASAGLATKVARAGSAEEREALVRSEPDLVNSELMEGISLEGSRALSIGRHQLAGELLALAERLARHGGARDVLARTLSRQGLLAGARQQWDAAFDRHEQALALFERAGNRGETLLCRLNMANARYSARRYADALGLYQAVVDSLGSPGPVSGLPGEPPPPPADAARLPAALQGLANAAYMLGDLTRAAEVYERVLRMHERAKNAHGTASALEAVARVRRDLGEYDSALEALGRAVALARTPPSLDAILVTSLRTMAEVYRLQGQYDRAIETARLGIPIAESIRDRAGTAELVFEVGLASAGQRRWPDALVAYERALALERQEGGRERIARALAATGTVLAAQGRHDAALERFRASLALREEAGDRPRVAWTLVHIGMTLQATARHDEALDTLHRSMMLFEQEDDGGAMGIAHAVTAGVQVAREDVSRALEHAERSIEYATAARDFDTIARARLTAGKAHRLAGADADARASFEAAVEALDALDRTSADVVLDRFFGDTVAPYHALADLLVAGGSPGEALVWTERSRVRLLRAIIGRVGAGISTGLSAAERDEESKLAREVVSLSTQLGKERGRSTPDASRLATLEAALAATGATLDTVRARLFDLHPRLAVMRARAPMPALDAIQSASAGQAWTAISFVVAERRVLGFVLTPTAPSPATFAVDIAPAELASRIGAYREMVERRQDGTRDEARALYDLLWKPVEALAGNVARVLVVPDSVLWALPFETLVDGKGRYLIEKAAFGYAPSLSSVVWQLAAPGAETGPRERQIAPGSHAAGPQILALANPVIGAEARARYRDTRPELTLGAMPEAAREARLVASSAGLTRTALVLGLNARKSALARHAGTASVLHLAAPAVISDASPMFSEILLAPDPAPLAGGAATPPGRDDDGTLTAAGLTSWEVTADLAVLSRAEREAPGPATGEGLIGLAWAFDVAGCPAVVVSRWRAESVATPGLMAELHRQLRVPEGRARAPRAVAESLRRAMLSVLKNPARREPWFWAAFLTIGPPAP